MLSFYGHGLPGHHGQMLQDQSFERCYIWTEYGRKGKNIK